MTVTAIPPNVQASTDEGEEKKERGGRKKKLLVLLAALLVLGGGAWFFLAPEGESTPVPGEVLTLDPIQVNLAAGHYLRLGLALQLVADAEHVDGSPALDAAITTFSGREVSTMVRAEDREALREELMTALDESYHGDVLEVYFTEFVTQ